MKFKNLLNKRVEQEKLIILDGGTGTEIQRRGVSTKLPLWSSEALMTHPELVKQIHKDYIQAGAEIVTTNTFRTTERTLVKVGKKKKAKELTKLAVSLVKQAIEETDKKGKVFIAGSIAPLEDCYQPELVPSYEEALKEHYRLARDLKVGGADFFLVETMNSLGETKAAIKACKKAGGLEVGVSFCVDKNIKLLTGESLKKAVKTVEDLGVILIMVNCVDIKKATRAVRKLVGLTNLPVGVYANGDGCPADDQGWDFSKDVGVEKYVMEAKKWQELGARIIGGCCGTSPEYIKILVKELE